MDVTVNRAVVVAPPPVLSVTVTLSPFDVCELQTAYALAAPCSATIKMLMRVLKEQGL